MSWSISACTVTPYPGSRFKPVPELDFDLLEPNHSAYSSFIEEFDGCSLHGTLTYAQARQVTGLPYSGEYGPDEVKKLYADLDWTTAPSDELVGTLQRFLRCCVHHELGLTMG